MVGIDLEQVLHPVPADVALPEEALDRDVVLEGLGDLDRLVGERVELGLGEVEAVVVAGEEDVDEDEDAQDEDDDEEQVARIEEGAPLQALS